MFYLCVTIREKSKKQKFRNEDSYESSINNKVSSLFGKSFKI
jgi:hypothetical protein